MPTHRQPYQVVRRPTELSLEQLVDQHYAEEAQHPACLGDVSNPHTKFDTEAPAESNTWVSVVATIATGGLVIQAITNPGAPLIFMIPYMMLQMAFGAVGIIGVAVRGY